MTLAFDLEQDILKCWNVTTDLGEILDDVEAGQMEIHEAVQALRAYQQVYDRRFEKCFKRFEDFNREVWELRRSMVAPTQDLDEPKNAPKKGAKMGKKRGKKAVDQ